MPPPALARSTTPFGPAPIPGSLPPQEPYEQEIERLRRDLRALSENGAVAAEVPLELDRLRRLEGLLTAKYEFLARERQYERDRCATLEMVARNDPQDAVLESILDLVTHQDAAIAASIFLLENSGLSAAASRGLTAEFLEELRLEPPQLSSPAVSGAAMMAQPVFIPSTAGLPNLDPFRQTLLNHGWQSLAVEPAVASDGQILGAVAFYGRQPGVPAARARTLLERVAGLAALALEHRKVYTSLAYQAHRDTLTSLPNRLCFHDGMKQALGSARRRGHKLALLRLNLDNFKHVNDMFGHRGGDVLLREIARRLRSAVRAADTVARMGGDEFAILLHEIDGVDGAAQAAEKVRTVLSAPVLLQGQDVSTSASIGISLFPDHATNPETLLRQADTALYAARRRGRNSFHFFAPEADAHIHQRFELEFQLRHALEQDEFHLVYQPQYSAQTCRITGVEALLRWTNPVIGLTSPERFIPIAESLGLIVPIGRWVLEEACRQAVRWSAGGHRLRMAVNVSAVQFERPDFTQTVLEVVGYTGMDPHLLELELTESCLMGDPEMARTQMEKLRAAGIRLSLDDFGTGYSSLSYLRMLPVDALKIDRSFIGDLGTDTANARLVEAVVRLAQSLRLSVVAEGVENHLQMAALSDMGCEYLQGFLFEKPHTADSIEQLLRTKR
ncbi:MAG TPA: EAL domain-containing protein [Bryobacteraceae bacterium]|nr:EAL domain-containing protein [Bryobacteraceae bacterium]